MFITKFDYFFFLKKKNFYNLIDWQNKQYLFWIIRKFYSHLLSFFNPSGPEMEKGGRSGRAACVKFSQLCKFLFVSHGFHFFVCLFGVIFRILAPFCTIFSIFCTYFVGKFFRLKVCQCYFVSFFHLCSGLALNFNNTKIYSTVSKKVV